MAERQARTGCYSGRPRARLTCGGHPRHDDSGFDDDYRGESQLPTYVSLVNWTEHGIMNYRDTVDRAQAFAGLVERSGGKVRELLWTVGTYDLLAVSEFPDDESGVAVLLQVGAGGDVRTTTLRAFNSEEMSGIIARTP